MRKRRGAVSVASLIVIGLMLLVVTTFVWAESSKPVDAAARVLAAAALKDTTSPAKVSGEFSLSLPLFYIAVILTAGGFKHYRHHYATKQANMWTLESRREDTTKAPFKINEDAHRKLDALQKRLDDLAASQSAEIDSLNRLKDIV